MMAPHNRAAARVHPRVSTPPRDRGVILGRWTSTIPDAIAVSKSTIALPNAAKLSCHHPTTPQWYVDMTNDANRGTYCQSRRRSPNFLSSSSRGSSCSRSSSSTTSSSTPASPSPIHWCHTHYQRSGSSHSYHRHSSHKHHSNQERRESTTVSLPQKVQHTIERGEFVDFSDLLCEPLMRAGKSAKTKKATQTRHIADLDTWLEAWTLYATVLANAKPQLAPQLFNIRLSSPEPARGSSPTPGFNMTPNSASNWQPIDPCNGRQQTRSSLLCGFPLMPQRLNNPVFHVVRP